MSCSSLFPDKTPLCDLPLRFCTPFVSLPFPFLPPNDPLVLRHVTLRPDLGVVPCFSFFSVTFFNACNLSRPPPNPVYLPPIFSFLSPPLVPQTCSSWSYVGLPFITALTLLSLQPFPRSLLPLDRCLSLVDPATAADLLPSNFSFLVSAPSSRC